MDQYKEMLNDSAAGQQTLSEHQQRDAAMTQAATDEGPNRHELAGFVWDMDTQISAAHATLAAQMQQNIEATRRVAEAHAQSRRSQRRAASRIKETRL